MTICHSTSSTTNPYEKITVDKSKENINRLYDCWLSVIIYRADKEKAEIEKMKSAIDAEFEEDEKRDAVAFIKKAS